MFKVWTNILPYGFIKFMAKKFNSTYAQLIIEDSKPITVKVWLDGTEKGFFISDISALKESKNKLENKLREIEEKIKNLSGK